MKQVLGMIGALVVQGLYIQSTASKGEHSPDLSLSRGETFFVVDETNEFALPTLTP